MRHLEGEPNIVDGRELFAQSIPEDRLGNPIRELSRFTRNLMRVGKGLMGGGFAMAVVGVLAGQIELIGVGVTSVIASTIVLEEAGRRQDNHQ
jgi:hypothetical protein